VVRQYYVPQVTDLSRQELQSVFDVAEPPVCLLGGWAVHVHVNAGFEREHGRAYIHSDVIQLSHDLPERLFQVSNPLRWYRSV
jgi:hypothetical protein